MKKASIYQKIQLGLASILTICSLVFLIFDHELGYIKSMLTSLFAYNILQKIGLDIIREKLDKSSDRK